MKTLLLMTLILAMTSCIPPQNGEGASNGNIEEARSDSGKYDKNEEHPVFLGSKSVIDTLYNFLLTRDSIEGEYIYATTVTENLAKISATDGRRLTAVVLYTGVDRQDLDNTYFEFKTVHVYGVVLEELDYTCSVLSVKHLKDCVTEYVSTETMEEHAIALNESSDGLLMDHIHTEPRSDDLGTDQTTTTLYIFDGKTLKSILTYASVRNFSHSEGGSVESISNNSLSILESVTNRFYDLDVLSQSYYVGGDNRDTTSTRTSFRWNLDQYTSY